MEWSDAFRQIASATSYHELFGPDAGDYAGQVRRIYHQFARVVHPDNFQGTEWYEQSAEVFARLSQFYQQALDMISQERYGEPVELIAWRSRKAAHSVRQRLGSGDICALYSAETQLMGEANAQASICKVAKASADNDLLQNEAAALRWLQGSAMAEEVKIFFPVVLDSFSHRETGKPNRQVNVLARLEGFYNLAQIRHWFPRGLPSVHMVWIWRKLLWTIGNAHRVGLIHGSVLPRHIMILPEQHGVVLVDWCYASRANDSGVFPPVKAIVSEAKEWYPEEVFAKQPPSPATDIAMAARCMVEILGGDPLTGNFAENTPVPRPFRAFFKGCLGRSQLARPQDALQLLGEFDQLLEGLGSPYYPRRFRTLDIPTSG
ncbi:MAG TPA: hypothetical protein VFT59_01050 [Candidatus Saccharimonadales bacterium]|nr:hypothetical protein [Candidatus Saccharimonadales bacterium]